jgi:hypothetical protein
MLAISEVMQTVVDAWDVACTIELIAPHIAGGAFNRLTNEKDRTGGNAPEQLWTGDARIQAVRWPNVATSRQEALSARTVVFHISRSSDLDPALILEGYRINVLTCELAPEFINGLFVVTTSVNSSYAWDRRIETMQDQGALIS